MSVDMPPLCSSVVEEFLCWSAALLVLIVPQATIWDVSLTPELLVWFGKDFVTHTGENKIILSPAKFVSNWHGS